MVREDAASKAARYLGEGRVIVEAVSASEVTASVRGSGAVYRVTFRHGSWACPCPARSECSHLLAVKAVVAPGVIR